MNIEHTKPSTNRSETRGHLTRRGKAVGMLAVAGVSYLSGVHHQGIESFFKHNAHTNMETKDFGQYGLAYNSDELAKVYKAEKIGDKSVTFYQIKPEEITLHDVAVDLHAKNANKLVADIIEPQLKDPVTHTVDQLEGHIVVVPNDQLQANR